MPTDHPSPSRQPLSQSKLAGCQERLRRRSARKALPDLHFAFRHVSERNRSVIHRTYAGQSPISLCIASITKVINLAAKNFNTLQHPFKFACAT